MNTDDCETVGIFICLPDDTLIKQQKRRTKSDLVRRLLLHRVYQINHSWIRETPRLKLYVQDAL